MLRNMISHFGCLVALLLLIAPPVQAMPADEFVQQISKKAFTSLGDENLNDAERVERFRVLLNEAFDMKRIGRFVLGRHWRTASDLEKSEFQDLFEKFIVQAYANRFRDLTNKKLVVIGSKELSAKESLVPSKIEIPGQPSVNVNWKVRDNKGVQKIVDVTVEGISMSVTQRDEFSAVIRQTGGTVSGLNKALKRKTSR